MKGYVLELIENGWPTIEIQMDVEQPNINKDRELLSLWSFDDIDECDRIVQELRAFRNQLAKEKA